MLGNSSLLLRPATVLHLLRRGFCTLVLFIELGCGLVPNETGSSAVCGNYTIEKPYKFSIV